MECLSCVCVSRPVLMACTVTSTQRLWVAGTHSCRLPTSTGQFRWEIPWRQSSTLITSSYMHRVAIDGLRVHSTDGRFFFWGCSPLECLEHCHTTLCTRVSSCCSFDKQELYSTYGCVLQYLTTNTTAYVCVGIDAQHRKVRTAASRLLFINST